MIEVVEERGLAPEQLDSTTVTMWLRVKLEAKIIKYGESVKDSETALGLAMRLLRGDPNCNIIHEEKLLNLLPGTQNMVVDWEAISTREKRKQVTTYQQPNQRSVMSHFHAHPEKTPNRPSTEWHKIGTPRPVMRTPPETLRGPNGAPPRMKAETWSTYSREGKGRLRPYALPRLAFVTKGQPRPA